MADMQLRLAVQAVLGADAERLLQHFNAIGRAGGQGFKQVGDSAQRAGHEINNVGKFGKFAFSVLQAFALYKGFVFLKTQVEQFIGALVDLEHQVAIVQTQLGSLGTGFGQQITQQIITVGQQTGLVFADLAKAEFQIVSANIALADSYDILKLSAKAAVAGGLQDVELAFNAALSQVNAFNLSNSQFGEVFDKQFNLVKRGIFTYEQFATVVGSISEAFASMGQDIETANASLAAISQIFTGKQLERGATGLRNAVLRIGEARADFEALGVAVVDTNGDFRNFIDIGRDLEAALKGLAPSDRFSAIKNLFPDERERRGIEAFLDQLDQAEQFYVEQKFAAGDLAEASDRVTDSLKVQAGILKNDLIPAADTLVSFLDITVSGFNKMDDVMPGLTRNAFTLAAAITAIAVANAALAHTRFPLTAATFGPGFGQLGASRAPTGLGLGVGVGFSALSGFGAASAPGLRTTDVLGGIAGGALGGAVVGGLPGAIAGAVISGVTFGITQAFEKEAPAVAESFGEAFKDALEDNAGDIAAAFSQALIDSKSVQGASFEEVRERAGRAIIMAEVSPGKFVPIEVDAGSKLASAPGAITAESLVPGAIESGFAAAKRFESTIPELMLRASSKGITTPEAQSQFIDIARTEFIAKQTREGGILGTGLEETVVGLVNMFDSAEVAIEAWGLILEGNTKALAGLMESARAAAASIADMGTDFSKFKGISEDLFGILEAAGQGPEAERLRGLSDKAAQQETLNKLVELGVPGASTALALLTGQGAPAEAVFETDEAQDLLDALGKQEEAVAEATEAVDIFAESMKRNAAEVDLLNAQANAQNRELTAEELDNIKRLELANAQMEIQRLQMEAFTNAMTEATKATEEEAAARRRALQANVFGGANLAQVRLFDRLTGGFQSSNNPILAQRAFQQFIEQMATQFSRSNQRGGNTIVFNGDTVPSELDMSIHRLESLGDPLAAAFARA